MEKKRLSRMKQHLNDFVGFDPVSFLKESKRWKSEIKRLKQELNALSELPAVEQSEIHTSSISNSTSRQAELREPILDEIARLEFLITVRDYALRKLSKKDKEIIDGFFFGKVSVYRFVDDFGRKYGMCQSDVYTARKNALARFGVAVTEGYLRQ